MLANRSIPPSSVIPELAYPEVDAAVDWLRNAFGFTVRLRIGSHRVQLNVGDGAVVARDLDSPADPFVLGNVHSVMVRVADVDAHHAVAIRLGARVVRPPADHPFGERQYTVEDLAGHRWTFSQSIADVDPREWGGISGDA